MVENSFHFIKSNHATLYSTLNAFPAGLEKQAALIFFVFICGGSFAVINETKALEIVINKLANRLAGREAVMICCITTIFSILGCVMGFNTETIIFIPLCVGLARRCGYDAIVGISMVLCGAFAGFTCGAFNPYTTVAGQGIAGLEVFSGLGFRLVWQAAILVGTCWYIVRYAKRVKADKTKSYCYEVERNMVDSEVLTDAGTQMNVRQLLVIITMISCFGIVIYNAVKNGWGTSEMMPVFLGMGIICGLIGGLDISKISKTWISGASSVAFGALAIGLGRGVLYVLESGLIMDTIVFALSSILRYLPSGLVAIGMFFINTIINFFVPSGSGQVALMLPFMLPIGQLTGVSAQLSLIAIQAGDGFSNMIIPTSGTTNACIGIADVGFEKWLRFSLPLWAVQACITVVAILIAGFIGV